MQRIASQRWPLVKLIVIDVLVQGTQAAEMISNGLRYADSLDVDAVIVGRGGGSIEDLWPFNEEVVANALFGMKTPVVSAVGHEIDWVISDYVSDLRAPTPSAAMQMLLPDRNELIQSIDEMRYGAYGMIMQRLERKKEQLVNMQESFKRHGVEHRLEAQRQQITELKERLGEYTQNLLRQRTSLVAQLMEAFESQHPKHKNKRGFAQIAKEGKVIDLDELGVGDEYEAMNDHRSVRSQVVEIIVMK
jgi:exodeoxyribonuclease VII large subunit